MGKKQGKNKGVRDTSLNRAVFEGFPEKVKFE